MDRVHFRAETFKTLQKFLQNHYFQFQCSKLRSFRFTNSMVIYLSLTLNSLFLIKRVVRVQW